MRIGQPGGVRGRLIQAALGGAALLGPGIVSAHAAAATLSVNRPCFVNVGAHPAAMVVGGTGYTPGDAVHISSSDGTVSATATANPSGNILATLGAPMPFFSKPGAKTVALSAQDFASSAPATTIPVTVAPLAATTFPSRARLSAKVTWFFSGFRPGRFVYGHYLRSSQNARARFGRAHGPCGLLKVRARFYPGGHPAHNRYKLQLDDSRRYSRHARPQVLVVITKTIL